MAGKKRRRSRGEGSSWQRGSDGRWVADWYDHTGKRHVVYAKTEKDARAKAAAKAQRSGPGEQTVARFLQRWLAWQEGELAAGHLSPKTLANQRAQVHGHIVPSLGHISLVDLRADHIRDFVAELRRKPGRGGERMAASSVHAIFVTLRQALNQAAGDRLIEWNPALAVRVPSGSAAAKPAVTPEVARAVLAAVAGDRLESLYLFGLSVGWRESEILAVGPEHVDLDNLTVTCARHLVRADGRWLFRPGSKTGKTVVAPIAPRLAHSLAARLEVLGLEASLAGPVWADWGLLWPSRTGQPMWPDALRRHLVKVCDRAGVPAMGPHHLFRRGASTLMAAEGISAKARAEILGHSRVATTENVYTDVLDPELRAAAERMDRLFGG